MVKRWLEKKIETQSHTIPIGSDIVATITRFESFH
jgi:hypothetical protein